MWLVYSDYNYIFYNLYNFFLNWWPYLTFWSDIFFMQVCFIYLFFLIIMSKNIYYVLLYLFIQVFLFGVYLGVSNLEFFTGFLWVIEGTIVFIFLLLLLYINFKGYINSYDMNIFFFNKSVYFFTILFFSVFFYNIEESYLINLFMVTPLWDDYYESIYNTNMNEFTQLLLSYYSFNSIIFIIVGLLLLIGSIVCVNLFKVSKNYRLYTYNSFFSFFSLFTDVVNYNFIRKQNLNNQNMGTPSTKLFKKKSNFLCFKKIHI